MPGPEAETHVAARTRPATWSPVRQFGANQLRWGLASLWILDACLQLQPGMFTRAFAGNVIYNAALMYQPGWLERILYWGAGLEARNLTVLTLAICLIQLALGVGLLVRPTIRAALVGSVAWALVVWVFGQGLGFMATGTALIEFGAPGSALLYIALALLIWRYRVDSTADVERSRLPRAVLGVWTGYWGLGAILHVPVRYGVAAVLAYNFQTAAQLQPGPLASIDYRLARIGFSYSVPITLGLALLETAVAAGVWLPALRRPTLVVGMAATVAFWVGGEAMGGLLSGTGTDPSTGPPVVLLGLAALGGYRALQHRTLDRSAWSPGRAEILRR